MGSADYYLLSKLGVVRNAKKELRHISAAYEGLGLYDFTCKTAGATLNSLLQDYGIETPLGIYLMTTLENLQVELGVQYCPLQYDFKKWGELSTHSWIKAKWEKVSFLGIEVEIN